MNINIVLALMIAWATIFVLKRLLKFFLMRGVGRVVLSAVGKQALQNVPQTIQLQKTEFPQWTRQAEVEQQAAPLRKEGFTDLGVYACSTIPGVIIRMMAHPQTYVAAHIYDHSRAGSWVELVTRYNDGSSHALTTMPPTGMNVPDWFTRIDANKSTPTDQLYRQFLTQRGWHNIKPVAPADTIREFEENYAKLMAWRQGSGISPEEVASVVRARSAKAGSAN